MLVLSRKCGEVIVISDNVRVTVLAVQGGRVKLGFAAPNDTPIHREETHARIAHSQQAETRRAMQFS